MTMDLAIPTAFEATPTALVVRDTTLPLDQWAAFGAELGRFGRQRLKFFVGDWLLAGETLYGEEHAQGVEATGYDHAFLASARRVAERVPPERRHLHLSWSHHAEVASLSGEEQSVFLVKAADAGWTRRQLAEAVAEAKAQGLLSVKPRKARAPRAAEPGAPAPLSLVALSRERARELMLAVTTDWQASGEHDGVVGLVEAMLDTLAEEGLAWA